MSCDHTSLYRDEVFTEDRMLLVTEWCAYCGAFRQYDDTDGPDAREWMEPVLTETEDSR